MKNKKLQYILIPLVILVWGLVFFKVFSHISRTEDFNHPAESTHESNPDTLTDTFTIAASYRDPFYRKVPNQSGQNHVKDRSVIPGRVRQQIVAEININHVQWPEIIFGGMIINEKDKSQIALLRVDGTDYLMKKGDEAMNIVVKSIFPDSIILFYNKEIKTFNKKTQ